MLMNIVLVVIVVIVALLVYAATRPDDFRVQRTTRIKAPADRIYPNIADFHKWAMWSPYDKLDPTMKKTMSGAPFGKGAVYQWSGNSKAGSGRMEIVEANEPAKVGIKLDFEKPFRANNLTEFTLKPAGDTTDVTWTMTGTSPLVMKMMGVFMNMDNLIGKDFVTGLESLKAIAEQDDRVLIPDSLGG